MSIHKKVAKDGLKKSLIFGGSVTAVTAGVGLGIAIPVYFDIQKQLHEALSGIIDLSKYITDLTSKLGVPPDSGFVKELEGGYEVVVENGQTHIYRSTGNGNKVLIMNTNPDGSVGSATQLQGPAALEILSVVTAAQEEFGEDVEAMNEILEAYKEEAETASRQVESLVLGLDPDEGPWILKIKDAISITGWDKMTLDQLKDIPAVEEIRIEMETEEGHAIDDAKWDELVEAARQQKENAVKAEEIALQNLDAISAGTFDFSSSPELQLLVENTNNPQIQQAIAAGEEERNQGMANANAQATDAHASISYNKMTEGGGEVNTNSNSFQMITSNPASWMNMFARALGGAYTKQGHLVSEPSQMLRMSLFNTLTQGDNPVDVTNFNNIVYTISDILGIPRSQVESNRWQNSNFHINLPSGVAFRSVSFNELINTYGNDPRDTTPPYSSYPERSARLFVLKVTITDYDSHGNPTGNTKEGMIVARSSTRRNSDFEKIMYFNPESDANKIRAIQYLILASTMDIEPTPTLDLRDDILSTLVDIADSGIVPEEVDDNVFNELMSITDFIHEQERYNNDFEQTLETNIVPLIKSFLLDGIDYQITRNSYENAINELATFTKFDKTIPKPSDEEMALDPTLTYDEFDDNVWVDIFDLIIPDSSFYANNNNLNTLKNANANSILIRKDQQLIAYTEILKTFDQYNDVPEFASLFTYIQSLSASVLYDKLLINDRRITPALLKNHFAQLEAFKSNPTFAKLPSETVFELLLSNVDDITKSLQTFERLYAIDPSINIDVTMMNRVLSSNKIIATLTHVNLSASDLQTISNKIDLLLSNANGLTSEQFNILDAYANNLILLFPSTSGANENVSSALSRVLNQVGSNKATNDKLLTNIGKFNEFVTGAKGSSSTLTIPKLFDYIWTRKNELLQSGKTAPTSKTTWDQFGLIIEYIFAQPSAKESELLNNIKPLLFAYITKGENYTITRDVYVNALTEIGKIEGNTPGIWTQLFNKILEPNTAQLNKNELLNNLVELMKRYVQIDTDYNFFDAVLHGLDLNELFTIVTTMKSDSDIILINKHITEIDAISGETGFNSLSDDLLLDLVQSPDTTIQFKLENYLRLANLGINSNTLEDPNFQAKIAQTAQVSQALSTPHAGVTGTMSESQITEVNDALANVIAHHQTITEAQFRDIVAYTNTVFSVFTSTNDIYEQLLKVFSEFEKPGADVNAICAKIHTFNTWVETIKRQTGRNTVTRDEIKNYVWTQSIHAESYTGTNVSGGGLQDGPITGASTGELIDPANPESGRRVYVLGHTTANRQLSILSSNGQVTTVTNTGLDASTFVSTDGAGDHMSALSRFIEDTNPNDDIAGFLYGVQLWNVPYYYKITIHQSNGQSTYTAERIGTTGEHWTNNARNVAVTPDGQYMYVFEQASKNIYRINLSTNVITKLSSQTSGNLAYGASAFEHNGQSYLVASSGAVGGDQYISIYQVDRTTGDLIMLDTMLVPLSTSTDNTQQISAFAIGDAVGDQIPIFVQGLKGDLVQVIFDTSIMNSQGDYGKFVPSETFTLLTAARTTQLAGGSAQDWRGMVYSGGAITIYGANKVIYIADQTDNLTGIFNLLMEH